MQSQGRTVHKHFATGNAIVNFPVNLGFAFDHITGITRSLSGMGASRPIKGYYLPRGGSRGISQLLVTKYKILKRLKVLENEWFSIISTLFLSKNPFYLRKIPKIEDLWQKFLNSSKNYFKNFNFNEGTILIQRISRWIRLQYIRISIYLKDLSTTLKMAYPREGIL